MKIINLGKIKIGIEAKSGITTLVIAGHKIAYYGAWRTPRAFARDVWFRVKSLARHLQLWPVYFVVFRRDCDCHESTTLRRYPCYFIALHSLRAERDEWTEGPFNYWQISRKEAKTFKNESRDRALEAFEDGRGTHTIISLAFILLTIVGCSEADQDKHWPRGQFELFDGTVVECRWVDQTPCGLKLHDCTDGQTYTCQTGVTEL